MFPVAFIVPEHGVDTASKSPRLAGYDLGACRPLLVRRCSRHTLFRAVQDPEGILAAPRAGHLNRQQLQKQVQVDQELQEQANRARDEARSELMRQREVWLAETAVIIQISAIQHLRGSTSAVCPDLLSFGGASRLEVHL